MWVYIHRWLCYAYIAFNTKESMNSCDLFGNRVLQFRLPSCLWHSSILTLKYWDYRSAASLIKILNYCNLKCKSIKDEFFFFLSLCESIKGAIIWFYSFSVCLHFHVCIVCLRIYTVCMHMCTYACRIPRTILGVFHLFFEKGSLIGRELAKLVRPAEKQTKDFPVFTFHLTISEMTGISMVFRVFFFFFMVSGHWTQDLLLSRQAVHQMSHLPRVIWRSTFKWTLTSWSV